MDSNENKNRLIDNIIKTLKEQPDAIKLLMAEECLDDPYNDLQRFLENDNEYQFLAEHLQVCEDCRKTAADLLYTDEKNQQLENLAQELLSKHFEKQPDTPVDCPSVQPSPMTTYAWAAASAETNSRQNSAAWGMAVYGDGKIVERLKCSAWVSKQQVKQGTLKIMGRQVSTLPDGSRITGPIEYLDEMLEELFANNEYLQAFHLANRKKITIDLGSEKILSDAGCLSLAMVMAVVKAACQVEPTTDTVYIADLEIGGTLKEVADIDQKIQGAYRQGFKTLIMAASQYEKLSQEQLLHSEDLQLLYFQNLKEVLNHESLLPEYLIVPEVTQSSADEYQAETPLAEWNNEHLSSLLPISFQEQCSNEEKTFLDNFFNLTADICLSSCFADAREMIIMIGQHKDFEQALSNACFTITEKNRGLSGETDILNRWTAILDNTNLALGITTDGKLDNLYRIDQQLADRPEIIRLFSGANRRSAILAKITGALIFHFLPSGRSINLFHDGRMAAQFRNGKWRPAGHDEFYRSLQTCCQTQEIDQEAAELAAAAAINLAQAGYGGIFAFIKPDILSTQNIETAPFSNNPDFTCTKKRIEHLSDAELSVMGRQEGAVIIDRKGFLVTFGAFFSAEVDAYPGINLRHSYAETFSRQYQTLVLVASRNGTVTIYNNGEHSSSI